VQCTVVYVAAHSEALWDLSAFRDEFVSADNEGSIILWSVKDDSSEGSELLVEKRIAISGMGLVAFSCSLQYIVDLIMSAAFNL